MTIYIEAPQPGDPLRDVHAFNSQLVAIRKLFLVFIYFFLPRWDVVDSSIYFIGTVWRYQLATECMETLKLLNKHATVKPHVSYHMPFIGREYSRWDSLWHPSNHHAFWLEVCVKKTTAWTVSPRSFSLTFCAFIYTHTRGNWAFLRCIFFQWSHVTIKVPLQSRKISKTGAYLRPFWQYSD